MCEAGLKGRRRSIALEKLLRATPLQVLFSIRRERQLNGAASHAAMTRTSPRPMATRAAQMLADVARLGKRVNKSYDDGQFFNGLLTPSH